MGTGNEQEEDGRKREYEAYARTLGAEDEQEVDEGEKENEAEA